MAVSHYLVDLCILVLLFSVYKLTAARRQQDGRGRWRRWRWRRRAAASELSGERRAHGPTCPTSPNPASTLSDHPVTAGAGVPSSEHAWRTRALPANVCSAALPPASTSTGREVSALPACLPLSAPVGSCGDGARAGSCERTAAPVPRSKLQLQQEVRSKMEFLAARKFLQIKLKCLPRLVLCSMEALSCPLCSCRARGRPVPVYFPGRESTFLPEEQREMLELHIRTTKLQHCKEHLGREQPSQRAHKSSTWTNVAHTAACAQHRHHRRGSYSPNKV